jgi:hypothetical protein
LVSDEPDFTALFDQALAELRTRAQFVRGYYGMLIGEGFTESQALRLTVAFQSEFAGGAPPKDDE